MKNNKLFESKLLIIVSIIGIVGIFSLVGMKQKYDNIVNENKTLQSENIDLQNQISEAANYINLTTKEKNIIDDKIKDMKYNTSLTYEDLKIKVNESCEFTGKVMSINKGLEFSKVILSIDNNKDKLVIVVIKNEKMNNINQFDNITVLGKSTGMISYTKDTKYPSILANEVIEELVKIE